MYGSVLIKTHTCILLGHHDGVHTRFILVTE